MCIWKKQAEQYWAWFLRCHLWPLFSKQLNLCSRFGWLSVKVELLVLTFEYRLRLVEVVFFAIKNQQLIRRTNMKSKLVMARVKWKLCSYVFFKIRFWSCIYGTVPLWSEKHFALKRNETSRDVPKSTWSASYCYAR